MPTRAKIVKVLPDRNLGVSLPGAQATRDAVMDTGEDIFTVLVARTEPLPGSLASYDLLAAITGLLTLDDSFGGRRLESTAAILWREGSIGTQP